MVFRDCHCYQYEKKKDKTNTICYIFFKIYPWLASGLEPEPPKPHVGSGSTQMMQLRLRLRNTAHMRTTDYVTPLGFTGCASILLSRRLFNCSFWRCVCFGITPDVWKPCINSIKNIISLRHVCRGFFENGAEIEYCIVKGCLYLLYVRDLYRYDVYGFNDVRETIIFCHF
jgi:hypothetical protein